MKFNFKKISAVAASVLMTGMTAGIAAAASYPAPFVDDGVANVAIVYGTGTGVSSLDMVQAGNIQTSLGESVEGTATVTGGESFTLEKNSDKFNYGDRMNSVYSTLDEDELPLTLVEGTYDDGDIDTDYSQQIKLTGEQLTFFSDNDYNDEEPTLGFVFARGDGVLEYEMDLDDAQLFADLEGTDLPLMGKEYYVLSTDVTGTNDIITLLDSASSTVMTESETVSVDGKSISVIIGDDSTGGWAKFTVDGETVDKMYDGGSEELDDGSWIAVKEVLYQSKDSATSSVEFTIGDGKLVLESSKEVEINEETVDGLYAVLTNASGLDKITLNWTVDDDTWLTEDDSLLMPGFDALQVIYSGMTFPDAEEISFVNGDELNIEFGDVDIPIIWTNGTTIGGLGEENNPLIVDATPASVTFAEDDVFIMTIIPTSKDLSDAETRYYEVTNIENDTDGDILVEFNDLIGNSDITIDDTDSFDDGDLTMAASAVVDATSVAIAFSTTIGTLSMSKIVTDKGLIIDIPTAVNTTAGFEETSKVFTLTEADDDENLGAGMPFTVTASVDTTDEKLHVTSTNVTTLETLDEDVWQGYVISSLATMVEHDKSNDVYDFDVMYYGEEITADVAIASAEASVSKEGALGDVLVKDSEVSSVASKNLVIVGGSCINSAAATALGVADHTCGAAFTEATGVGMGEFLIKGVQDAFTAGKLALVVAGYEAADTANAATYLTMKDVDTSKEYKGTTATEATLVTA